MTKIRYIRRNLAIKGEYARAILEGRKRTTIRLGVVKPRRREVVIHSGGRAIAKAKIISYRYKKIKDLTDNDARLDGFRSLDELLADLKRHYGEIREDDVVTVIEFEVTKRLGQRGGGEPYGGLSPADVASLAIRYDVPLSPTDKGILKELLRTGSIRKAAKKLFGSINKRWIVRKAVKRAFRELIKLDMIGPRVRESNRARGTEKSSSRRPR